MTDQEARTFSADFRRFFLRGLVVLLPTVLTLWILVHAYRFVDTAIAEPINGWVRVGMNEVAPYSQFLRDQFDPSEAELNAALATIGPPAPSPDGMVSLLRAQAIDAWWRAHWYMNLIGLLLAVIAVYVVGRLLGGYIGRKLYGRVERLITTLPVFKQVYPYVKQIVDFLFSDDKSVKFNRVVIAEYPRKGVWSLGFQTSGALRGMDESVGELVTVFIPSAPTPFTGYAVTLPRCDVRELPITVEEAFRFIVSCGVLTPGHLPSPSTHAIHRDARSTPLPVMPASSGGDPGVAASRSSLKTQPSAGRT